MARNFETFIAETRGNLAVVTAVGLGMLLLGVGTAIDFNRATSVRQNLQTAGDVGALAASAAFRQDPSLSKSKLKQIAKEAAESNCLATDCGTHVKAKPRIENSEIIVDMTSLSDNKIISILKVDDLDVSSTSVAGIGAATTAFTNVYIIPDVSGSMNIPDSPAEIAELMDNYKPWGMGCAFACHVPAEPHQNSGLSVARSRGLYLREDRIKDEVSRLGMELLSKGQGYVTLNTIPYTWKVVDRRLGDRTEWDFTQTVAAFPATSDDTQAYTALSAIANEIPMTGSGASQSDPIVIAILITDGVEQETPHSKDSKAIDPAKCDLIKAKVDKLYVLNVVYPHPDTTNASMSHDRTNQVRTFYDQLKPNLQACASSPDAYFEGEFGTDIAAAFDGISGNVGEDTVRATRLIR